MRSFSFAVVGLVCLVPSSGLAQGGASDAGAAHGASVASHAWDGELLPHAPLLLGRFTDLDLSRNHDDAPPAPRISQSSPPVEDGGVGGLTVAAIVLMAFGASSLGLVGISSAILTDYNNDPEFSGFRGTLPPGEDACRQADAPARVREICDDAPIWEALAITFLATGVASLGTGVTFLAIDLTRDSGETQASLRPHLGFGRLGLDLVGGF